MHWTCIPGLAGDVVLVDREGRRVQLLHGRRHDDRPARRENPSNFAPKPIEIPSKVMKNVKNSLFFQSKSREVHSASGARAPGIPRAGRRPKIKPKKEKDNFK